MPLDKDWQEVIVIVESLLFRLALRNALWFIKVLLKVCFISCDLSD